MNKKNKVLNLINDPDGFSLTVGFDQDMVVTYIDASEIGDEGNFHLSAPEMDEIAEELVKFITSHPQQFHLYRTSHLNKVGDSHQDFRRITGGRVWWDWTREVRHIDSGNTLQPFAFLKESQYARVYEAIVENLSKSDYKYIDANDTGKSHYHPGWRDNLQHLCSSPSLNPLVRNYSRSNALPPGRDVPDPQVNQSGTSTSSPSVWNIQFTINQVDKPFPEYDLFWLETEPFVVDGKTITKVIIEAKPTVDFFEYNSLQQGGTISITDVKFGPDQASISDDELSILKFYFDVQTVQTTGVGGTNEENELQTCPHCQEKFQEGVCFRNDPETVFCSAECAFAWKREKQDKRDKKNLIEQRVDFIAENLKTLLGWNSLSEEEKENFIEQVNNSESKQFENILRQAKKLIREKQKSSSREGEEESGEDNFNNNRVLDEEDNSELIPAYDSNHSHDHGQEEVVTLFQSQTQTEQKIEKLLKESGISDQQLDLDQKELLQGIDWKEYLKKLDTPTKIKEFANQIEQAVLKLKLASKTTPKDQNPKNKWLLPVSIVIVSFLALTSLVLIVRRKRRKI